MSALRPALFASVSLVALVACSTPPATVDRSPVRAAPEVPGDPMGVVIRRLPNGLTVMLSPNHEEPRITAWITTRAGSAKDPSEATGMAHYLEHMLFKGTRQLGTLDYAREAPHLERITQLYDRLFGTTDADARAQLYAEIDAEGVAASEFQVPNELDQLYDALGCSGLNAFTSDDQTSYTVEIPANRVEQWARVEGDRFAQPVFRLFQTELEAVYEEMNQSLDSKERALFEALHRALWPRHPYGTQPTIGTVEHLKNPSIRKMYEYFERWYVPGNMCVALAGDFDPDDVLATLERTLGRWPARPVPADPVFPLDPPHGRVFHEIRHRGEEQVALAYLTVPAAHPDRDALVLCDMLLDNSETGLVNVNLSQAQAVRAAGASPTFNVDSGYELLWAVPKTDQTLEECEALLLEQVRLLREGAFDESDIAAVVTDFEVGRKRGLESNDTRVGTMTAAFVERTPWSRSVHEIERLRKLTKADVVAAARRWFGDDRVVVYRRNGEPELPEVTKPAFTPVDMKGDVHTPFFASVLDMPVDPIEPHFAVKGVDYSVADYPWGRLYYAHNDVNDVFDVSVRFDVGSDHDPRLDTAFDLLALAGADDADAVAYRRRLYALGSSVVCAAGDDETVFSASGLDAHFAETVALLRAHTARPAGVTQQDLDTLVERTIGARAVQKTDPRALNAALVEYALHGPESRFLKAPTDAALRALNVEELFAAVRDLWTTKRTVTYVGSLAPEKVAELVAAGDTGALREPPARRPETYVTPAANRIVFLQNGGAQARVALFAPDGTLDPEQAPLERLYDEYMSGSMGSVVFQEVREARSLAYSVFTDYAAGARRGDANLMRGAMSNQQDKVPEALDVLLGLVREMPPSEVRLEQVRRAVDEAYRTNRLGFRRLPTTALTWDRWGLDGDPREANWRRATSLTLDELVAFAGRFRTRPFTVTVLGDRDAVDLPSLARFGTVEEVQRDALFNW